MPFSFEEQHPGFHLEGMRGNRNPLSVLGFKEVDSTVGFFVSVSNLASVIPAFIISCLDNYFL